MGKKKDSASFFTTKKNNRGMFHFVRSPLKKKLSNDFKILPVFQLLSIHPLNSIDD